MQILGHACRVVAVGVIGSLSLTGAAHATGSPKRSAAKPIVIAVEGPITGSQSSNGVDMVRGVRLAVRQANADGGVLGRRVRLVEADDRGEQERATKVAQDVIRRKAHAVIGPYNSSVGIVNLPIYLRERVVPVHLTSSDDTMGEGITVQPKNSQLAPVEDAYLAATGARVVTMLVDDTAQGAFTIGMATRLRDRLTARGVTVNWISVLEAGDVSGDYYAGKVAEAIATNPDQIYVSTYYPEGVRIAEALNAAGSSPSCLMGLANVDPAFVAAAGLQASRRCRFSGIPAAGQLPSARQFTRQYRSAFDAEPGVWGVFTYDSAKLLFSAMERARTTTFDRVLTTLRHTTGYRGATGTITIDPETGYRRNLPVSILTVDGRRHFVIAP